MMRILALAIGALLAFAPAQAADEAAALRQPAIDWCVKSMGSDAPAKGATPACTCMIDRIIVDFGPDAPSMLKILIAGLNPSDVGEIAKILGRSQADAQKFIDEANAKLEPIQTACMS